MLVMCPRSAYARMSCKRACKRRGAHGGAAVPLEPPPNTDVAPGASPAALQGAAKAWDRLHMWCAHDVGRVCHVSAVFRVLGGPLCHGSVK